MDSPKRDGSLALHRAGRGDVGARVQRAPQPAIARPTEAVNVELTAAMAPRQPDVRTGRGRSPDASTARRAIWRAAAREQRRQR